jgi:hypothetical protein
MAVNGLRVWIRILVGILAGVLASGIQVVLRSRRSCEPYVLSNFSRNDEDWLVGILRAVTEEADILFGSDPGVWLTKVAENLRR